MKKRTILFLFLLAACLSAASIALGETAVFHLCPGVDVDLSDGRFLCEGTEGSGLCTLTDTMTGAVYEFDVRDDESIMAILGVPVEAFRAIIQRQWRRFTSRELRVYASPKSFGVFLWAPFTTAMEQGTSYRALVFTENRVIFADFGYEPMDDNGEAVVRLLRKAEGK